jgi:hypothetical protein
LATPPVKWRSAPTTDMLRETAPLSQTSVNRRRRMIKIKPLPMHPLDLFPRRRLLPRMSQPKIRIKRELKRLMKLCTQLRLKRTARGLKLRL